MKTVLITGVTGGLGSSLAKQACLDDTMQVIGTYRNPEKFQMLFQQQLDLVTGYQIGTCEKYTHVFDKITDASDELICILNAFTIAPIKAIGTYSEDEIEEMLDVNIRQAVCLLNRLVAYQREKNRSVRIINIDSGAADFPLKGWGNYCAAKAYINAFLGVIQLENPQISIVSVDPGVMDTSMQEQIRKTAEEVFDQVNTFRAYKESGRLRKAQDVAAYIMQHYVENWDAQKFREKISL